MQADEDPWEQHAAWWQEGFTEGADAEYEEQILPLAAELLSGYDRVLDIGAGEGQVSRLASSGGSPCVVGIDPSLAQAAEALKRAGGPAYARAEASDLRSERNLRCRGGLPRLRTHPGRRRCNG